MITETFTPGQVEEKKAEGWTVVKENIFGGKVRSVKMEKEGEATQWISERLAIRAERLNEMSKTQRRIFLNNERLRNRGMDC